MYRTEFAETEVIETDTGYLIWEGRMAGDVSPGSLCEAPLGYDFEEQPSVHRQRHFPEGVALDALAASGLECLRCIGHVEDAVFKQPLDELHLKASTWREALQWGGSTASRAASAKSFRRRSQPHAYAREQGQFRQQSLTCLLAALHRCGLKRFTQPSSVYSKCRYLRTG